MTIKNKDNTIDFCIIEVNITTQLGKQTVITQSNNIFQTISKRSMLFQLQTII